MKLTGDQIKAIVTALSEGFTLAELRRLTTYQLDTEFDDIVPAGATKPDAAFTIATFSVKRNLIPKLLQGARGLNPAMPELLRFYEVANVDVVRTPADRQELQRIVSQRSTFQKPADFRERMAVIETWVCRIEIPGGGGTGLLVHDDLVLTNYHVMEPVFNHKASRDDVVFRFDYRAMSDGTVLLGDTRCALAATWDIDNSPPSLQDEVVDGAEPQPNELDYALVQITPRLGHSPISSNDPQAPNRRWFFLGAPVPAVVANDPLMVLQYPSDLDLQLAFGTVLGHSPHGLRIRHNARTKGGSSGSPCFDANLGLVALHHAGDPDYSPGHQPTYNQAIPIGRIRASMAGRGVRAFWEDNPP
jgi:hypothetical protein